MSPHGGAPEGICETSPIVWHNVTMFASSKLGVMGVVLALELLLPPLFVLMFWRAKLAKYSYLKQRPLNLVITTSIGIWIHAMAGPLAFYTNIQCAVHVFITFMLPALIGGPLFMRILLFVQLSRFQALAVKHRSGMGASSAMPTHTHMKNSDHGWRRSSLFPHSLGHNPRGFCHMFCANRADDFLLVWSVLMNPVALVCGGSDSDKNRTLLFLRFLRSKSGIASVIALVELPYVVTSIAIIGSEQVYVSNCFGCHILYGNQFYIFAILTFSIFFLIIVLWFYALRLSDAWGFRRETMLCLGSLLVAAVGFFMATRAPASPDTWFDWQEVQALGFLSDLFMSTVVQVWLARRREPGVRKSGQVTSSFASSTESATGGRVPVELTLDAVMQDAELAKRFEAHLVHEFAVESLLFVRAHAEYVKLYASRNDKERVAAAMAIFGTYINRQGLFAVNIDGPTTTRIVHAMDGVLAANDVPAIDLFDEAAHEIRSLLAIGALKRFPWRKGSLVVREEPLGV